MNLIAAGVIELTQQLLLPLGQFDRYLNLRVNIHIATDFGLQNGHALVAQPELLARLCALRNVDLRTGAVDRRHFNCTPQRSDGHRDRHPTVDIRAIALEKDMCSDR